MLAFCHIPKTAGMAVNYLLRRALGHKHLETTTARKCRTIYDWSDLRWDLRLNPFVTSIAGHGIRPFADYGPLQGQLRWFTFLRDPVARVTSQFAYDLQRGRARADADFERWMEHCRTDCQVQWLTGERNLDAAKRALDRFCYVGIQEHFSDSVLLLRDALGVPGLEREVARRINATEGQEAKAIAKEIIEANIDLVLGANELDAALYEYGVARWQAIATAGRLAAARADLETERTCGAQKIRATRAYCQQMVRTVVYKPTYLVRVSLPWKSPEPAGGRR